MFHIGRPHRTQEAPTTTSIAPTPTGFVYDGFYNAGQLAVLLDAVGDLPISDAERRTLYWLSGWEVHTVENLAALITRARQASD